MMTSSSSPTLTTHARRLLVDHGSLALDAFLSPSPSGYSLSHTASMPTAGFVHRFAQGVGIQDARLARAVALVVDPLNLGVVQLETVSALVRLISSSFFSFVENNPPPSKKSQNPLFLLPLSKRRWVLFKLTIAHNRHHHPILTGWLATRPREPRRVASETHAATPSVLIGDQRQWFKQQPHQ